MTMDFSSNQARNSVVGADPELELLRSAFNNPQRSNRVEQQFSALTKSIPALGHLFWYPLNPTGPAPLASLQAEATGWLTMFDHWQTPTATPSLLSLNAPVGEYYHTLVNPQLTQNLPWYLAFSCLLSLGKLNSYRWKLRPDSVSGAEGFGGLGEFVAPTAVQLERFDKWRRARLLAGQTVDQPAISLVGYARLAASSRLGPNQQKIVTFYNLDSSEEALLMEVLSRFEEAIQIGISDRSVNWFKAATTAAGKRGFRAEVFLDRLFTLLWLNAISPIINPTTLPATEPSLASNIIRQIITIHELEQELSPDRIKSRLAPIHHAKKAAAEGILARYQLDFPSLFKTYAVPIGPIRGEWARALRSHLNNHPAVAESSILPAELKGSLETAKLELQTAGLIPLP